MKKFTLAAKVTVSATVEVSANTLEEAIALSENLPVMYESEAICVEDDQVWVVGEIDGSATDIHCESD